MNLHIISVTYILLLLPSSFSISLSPSLPPYRPLSFSPKTMDSLKGLLAEFGNVEVRERRFDTSAGISSLGSNPFVRKA